MFGTNYLQKSQQTMQTINKKMYGIESLLEDSMYQIKKNPDSAKKYDAINGVYSKVQEFRENAKLKFGQKDYKSISDGLEEIASGVEIVEKSVPNLGKYRVSTIGTVRGYISAMKKAVAEPEKAKSCTIEFLKNCKKKNSFTEKLAKSAYNRAEPEDKIKILKAYTNGVLDASAMETFGVSNADVDRMIRDCLLKVKGYKTYIIK